ncbi:MULTISPECIES: hypothetical protein [unclassified Arthrobacter]|uniref:hypothetical protein n=1 Tax=unclassified Arthrobacter TaxID=235627 RepID=UPI001C8653EA|nr:hypothetical protein [Arthrobacter sp. MAHUQ-56]MBX7443130.1 hypothetical protein [Arthrobacter sp. MAHUQ-56]
MSVLVSFAEVPPIDFLTNRSCLHHRTALLISSILDGTTAPQDDVPAAVPAA